MKSFCAIFIIVIFVTGCQKQQTETSKSVDNGLIDSIGNDRASIPRIEAVLDSVSKIKEELSPKEITRHLDTFYLPIRGSDEISDSLPAIIEVERRVLSLNESSNSPIVVKTVYTTLTQPDAEWGRQMLSVELISNGKSIYSEKLPPTYPTNRFGYERELSYIFSVKRYQGRTIIEQSICDAPSMASETGYQYYLFSDTEKLRPFSQPQEVIFRNVHVDGDSVYTLFTFGCMTCRIPLSVDLQQCSIAIDAADSSIFPVVSHHPDQVPADFNSIHLLSFYERPNIGAQHRNIHISAEQPITVLKVSVPRGPIFSYDEVWAYVDIAGHKGWISKEAQDRLGLTGCD